MTFNLESFDVAKFNALLDERGLCYGVGDPNGQMCIEAAICYTLGLPHGDDPGCVAESVRSFKIKLNDANWSSPKARAEGLRKLGIAQLGSLGVVDDRDFAREMAIRTVNTLIPRLYREVLNDNEACLSAAKECESVKDLARADRAAANAARADRAAWAAASAASSASSAWADRAAANAARAAANAASAASAAWAAANAASSASSAWADRAAANAARAAANAASAASAAWAAASADSTAWAAARADRAAWAAASAASAADQYLILQAEIALEVLKELGSPGCKLL